MTALYSSTIALLLIACGSPSPSSEPAQTPQSDASDPCAQKTPEQCLPIALEFAKVGSKDENTPLAAQLLKRGCDAKHGPSCMELATLHLLGTGVPRDQEASFMLMTTACDLGEADGCYFAARAINNGLLQVLMNGEEATPEFEASLPQERQAIKTLLEKACKLGHTESCESLESRMAADTMPWELPQE